MDLETYFLFLLAYSSSSPTVFSDCCWSLEKIKQEIESEKWTGSLLTIPNGVVPPVCLRPPEHALSPSPRVLARTGFLGTGSRRNLAVGLGEGRPG